MKLQNIGKLIIIGLVTVVMTGCGNYQQRYSGNSYSSKNNSASWYKSNRGVDRVTSYGNGMYSYEKGGNNVRFNSNSGGLGLEPL